MAPPPTHKGGGHRGGRGGGAWKVAYADFVTAMMALFIVLWMMNSGKTVKESISGYFKDPKGYTRQIGAGPANAEVPRAGAENAEQLRAKLEAALRAMPDFQKLREHVQFSVTEEGFRIDLLETEEGMFFVTGSASPTGAGTHLLRALALELGRMPNRIVVEGHTDARPFRNAAPVSGYGNWELSVDRANAARRLLHTYGIAASQVVEVRGFADQKLLNSGDAGDPRNRRVSVVVKL